MTPLSAGWGTSHNNTDYQTACLFILDIDDFKLINDRYGHGAGDQALIQLAKTLCAHVRTPAQLCRWGGDEFIGIIPGDADKVLRRVENIRRSAGSLVIDEKIRFSISAGIADTALLADRTDVSGIVALADQALYRAKKSGKGTICIY